MTNLYIPLTDVHKIKTKQKKTSKQNKTKATRKQNKTKACS